jgi:lipoprotein-releasing system permease protein
MLIWDFFQHFIFSPRAGALIRRISLLSFIGIAFSVTAFLVVLFVMNGMNANIKKRILGLEPHLHIHVAGVSSANLLEAHPVFQRIREDERNRASVYETQDVILRTQEGQFRGGIARGVSRSSLQHFVEQLKKMDLKLIESNDSTNYLDPQDLPKEGEILIGVDLAHSLGVLEGDFLTIVSPAGLLLPPGETPRFERVQVKKIITTTLADVDSRSLFYQRGVTLNSLVAGGMRNLGIEVWLSDENDLDKTKESLVKFDGVSVETWTERNSALLYALKMEKLTIGIFLGLAGMIAASSILTVLSLLMSQKRRDIAILKTVGLSGAKSVRIFTQIGFMLAFAGVLLGVFIGTCVSLYLQINPLILQASQIYYDPSIPALVDFTLVVGVLLISGLICLLGAYIPARTASEVVPSDALRIK